MAAAAATGAVAACYYLRLDTNANKFRPWRSRLFQNTEAVGPADEVGAVGRADAAEHFRDMLCDGIFANVEFLPNLDVCAAHGY
jgi:hypothetical protein